jgi:hypothetical protein
MCVAEEQELRKTQRYDLSKARQVTVCGMLHSHINRRCWFPWQPQPPVKQNYSQAMPAAQ